jgi:hypothetical protein
MSSLATVAQRSERPILQVVWTHADNTTGENLTGATLSGYIKDLSTDATRPIAGTFAIVTAASGIFSWQPDPADVANAGAHQVQFEATFAGEPTPARTVVYAWEIAESIVPVGA